MSGHATIDTAVEATRIGALDFLEKPIALQKLLKAVEQGLSRGRSQVAPKAAPPIYQPLSSGSGGSLNITMLPVNPGGLSAPIGSPTANFLTAPVAGIGGAAATVRELPLDLPLREARDAFERAYFEHHLSREHGSMTRVAEKTGLERTHLYRKLKQLGIDLSKGAYRKSGGAAAQ
jgi:DNA-binding NtrC family response regulator